ncbi:hypothetical protein L5M38_20475 [Shewanella sp. SM101]|jgi:hypothetical protein|uniref:hypothetical protein n=1 Tax=Shewanella TaxID=22 RepID=UPI0002112D89|nr:MULTISPECIES: hypothetical protein [Shewanella]AEH16224.1 hypothetical protein Sbal117_4586 [Shewanella baltica OS117]MCU8008947.1 hypothetical protein [Shewanella sp. SM87]MCU8106898.1 hypothetical protein [Shewanella sp. SM101]
MEILRNPEYDEQFRAEEIAAESRDFSRMIKELLSDTDSDYPTNKVWLGTVLINGVETQIQIVATQERSFFIDEN